MRQVREGYFRQRVQDIQRPRGEREQDKYSFLELEKFVIAGTLRNGGKGKWR